MELESFYNGVLLYVGVKEGIVPVDGIIAIIGEKGENVKEILAAAEGDNPTAAKETAPEAATPVAQPAPVAAPAAAAPAAQPVPSSNGSDRLKASPLA
ncbi:unnamed protein product, partial [Cyprideis torosa]